MERIEGWYMVPDGVLVILLIEAFVLHVDHYPSPEFEGLSSVAISLLANAVVCLKTTRCIRE